MAGEDLRIVGLEKLEALSEDLRLASKDLRREILKSLRAVTTPLGERAEKNLRELHPSAYGADSAAALKVRATVRTGGRPSVRLKGTAETNAGKSFRLARRKSVRAARRSARSWAGGRG